MTPEWIEQERLAYEAHKALYGEWAADIAFGFGEGDIVEQDS